MLTLNLAKALKSILEKIELEGIYPVSLEEQFYSESFPELAERLTEQEFCVMQSIALVVEYGSVEYAHAEIVVEGERARQLFQPLFSKKL